jgi:hypothetical protein
MCLNSRDCVYGETVLYHPSANCTTVLYNILYMTPCDVMMSIATSYTVLYTTVLCANCKVLKE